MDSHPRLDDHTVDTDKFPGTYDELIDVDSPEELERIRAWEVLQWWNGLTDTQRHHYEYIGFKRYGASEGLHEASDAHLYGRCNCPNDSDDSSSVQVDNDNSTIQLDNDDNN